MNLMGERSNVTYYDNVRVSKNALVGEENKGWEYITTQLALERLMLSTYSRMERMVEETVEWANETVVDGTRVIENPWVQETIAELIVKIEVLRLLNYRAAWSLSHESAIAPYRPSMNKVFAAELHQEVYDKCMQIMGMFGQVKSGSKWAVADGSAENLAKRHLVYLFGGGANDIQRDLIARFGLGLPRS